MGGNDPQLTEQIAASMTSWRAGIVDAVSWLVILIVMWFVVAR
jgi:hypothetical protein